MTASTTLRPAVRAALHELIDYAGLFPPAQLSLDAAMNEYQAARARQHAWMLGRFIIPATVLASRSGIDARLSVITDATLNELDDLRGLLEKGTKIEALEVPLTNLSPDETVDAIDTLSSQVFEAGLEGLPVFVEIPRSAGSQPPMGALQSGELGAKLRCGGVTADAFPSVDEVAEFISAATSANVPFKATAGLHHPVRHRDSATGFVMHGFLNLLGAAALAPHVERETLNFIVAEENPAAFRFDDESFSWRDKTVNVAQLQQTRRAAFVAYGSCSFSEPVEDLIALGILPRQ